MSTIDHWLIDGLECFDVREALSSAGIETRWVGELTIPPELGLVSPGGREYYIDMPIARDTHYTFDAGTPGYELVRPDGRTYVMQAYSHEVDDQLTMQSLRTLGEIGRGREGVA